MTATKRNNSASSTHIPSCFSKIHLLKPHKDYKLIVLQILSIILKFFSATSRKVRFSMGSLGFSMTKSFRPHYDPGVGSASNRNEYKGYLLGVKAVGD